VLLVRRHSWAPSTRTAGVPYLAGFLRFKSGSFFAVAEEAARGGSVSTLRHEPPCATVLASEVVNSGAIQQLRKIEDNVRTVSGTFRAVRPCGRLRHQGSSLRPQSGLMRNPHVTWREAQKVWWAELITGECAGCRISTYGSTHRFLCVQSFETSQILQKLKDSDD
jgi:hypothetical protein